MVVAKTVKTRAATSVIVWMRVVTGVGGDGDFCQDDGGDGGPALLPSGKGWGVRGMEEGPGTLLALVGYGNFLNVSFPACKMEVALSL